MTCNCSLPSGRKAQRLGLGFWLSHHTSPPIWHLQRFPEHSVECHTAQCPPRSSVLLHLYLLLCHPISRLTLTPPWQFWDITTFGKLSWAGFGASALSSYTHIPLLSASRIILQMTLYGFLSTLGYIRLKRGIIFLFIPISQGLTQCRRSTGDSGTNQSCNKLIIPSGTINFCHYSGKRTFYSKWNKLSHFG